MMKQMYTYKFAIKPTRSQAILLNKHAGAVRYLYNYGLKQRQIQYLANKDLPKEEKKYIKYFDQCFELTKLKQDHKTGWLKEINSQSLQQTLKHLDGAYNDFFKGRTGFPQYHSKYKSNSFRIPQSTKVENGKVYIRKFKEGIELVEHQKLEGIIKFSTVTCNPDGTYYISITVEKEIEELSKTGKSVGIDIGIKDTFVTSEGIKTGNPKATKKYAHKLKYFQRQISRKLHRAKKLPVLNEDGTPRYTKKGRPKFYAVQGSNCHKLRKRIAKYHTKIKDRRLDHIHKATTNLVRKFDLIVVEDLHTKGMVKNHKLAKAIHDASFGEVGRQLEYKSKWYGRQFVKIDRWYPSSKTCSQCAVINNNLTLKDRDWTCNSCGKYHDRDHNAAKNILAKGISMLAGTHA